MMSGVVFVVTQLAISTIEGLIGYYYSKLVFRKKEGIRYPIIFWMAGYFVQFVISLAGIPWLNTSAFLLANLILFLCVYKVSIQQAIVHALIFTAVMCSCELIIIPLQASEIVIVLEQKEYSFWMIMIALAIKGVNFIVMRIMGKLFASKKSDDRWENRYYLIDLVPLISIFIFFVVAYSYLKYKWSYGFPLVMSMIGIAILVINMIVYWVYGKIQKDSRDKAEMQVLLQKKNDEVAYYKLLQEQDENLRVLRHDFKKHLSSIRELYGRGEMKEADRYVEDLEKQMDSIGRRYCDSVVLDLMLNHYAIAFSEMDVSFSADIRTGTIENMQRDDITSLFGNLLENAYEATANLPGSYVELSVTRTKDDEATLITMVNTCDKDPFIDGEPVSTKESSDEHGYGIKSIRQVVKKYHGEINMYYRSTSSGDSQEGEFHTVIRMKD